MIELLIFHLHIVGVIYSFTKNWQNRSTAYGLLSILVIGLFFTIGWALTGAIARAVFPIEWNTLYFTQDTLSLVLLLGPEIVFFYFFFVKDKVGELNQKPENTEV